MQDMYMILYILRPAHTETENVKLTFYMPGFKNVISPQENCIYILLYYIIP